MKIRVSAFILAFILACAAPAAKCMSAPDISATEVTGIRILQSGSASEIELEGSALPAKSFEPVIDPYTGGRKTVEYFFTCLALPDGMFWVDLNPSGKGDFAEKELASTDMGRILLAADLRLKRDTSELTNPQSSKQGREFWNRMYAKADELGIRDRIPVSSRVWITPGRVRINDSGSGMSIVEARLKVNMESFGAVISDSKMAGLQEYARKEMEELIIPALEEKVNAGYGYAELRQLYRIMVTARWYKGKTGISVSRASLRDLKSDYPYAAEDIYRDYLESLKNGEYSFTEPAWKIDLFMKMISRRYSSGGMKFTRIAWDLDGGQPPAGQGIRFVLKTRFGSGARPLSEARDNLQVSFQNPDGGLPRGLLDNIPASAPFPVEERMVQGNFASNL